MTANSLFALFAIFGIVILWIGVITADNDISGMGMFVFAVAAIFWALTLIFGPPASPASVPTATPVPFCIPVTATPEALLDVTMTPEITKQ